MSDNQNVPTSVNTQNQQAAQQTAQVQKTSMFYYYDVTDIWVLHPAMHAQLTQFWGLLTELRQRINKKWSEAEINAYITYIDSIFGVITGVTAQTIVYHEDYVAWLQYYKTTNPKGFELYQKQLDYLQKLSEGHDFYSKNKSKDPNAPKQQPKKKQKQQVQQKEKVVVRTSDPQINLQKLMKTEWDTEKYLSTSFLAKQNANIVFIGHVDSGKSTLTGNILRELKEVDQQEMIRNKQDAKDNKMEAWEQAGISDIIPEERQDGKTRQFAKLNFSLEKKRFTLFDAPGHKNYVPNMIMGACQADVAVLIVSAKQGEFESGFQKDGQTKEHAMLAKALGVHELIVVVTKMGTVNWSQKRFTQIKEAVLPFLENNCGFHNVQFIPVESILNTNIHTRIEGSWYKGKCFLEYLDNLSLPERKPLAPLRIPIIDKFKDQGNIYVYGKLQSGTLIEDQTVTVLPQRILMVIKEIFNAKDQRMAFACAGQNVKLRVKNVEENDINRGDMICNNLNYCQESSQLKSVINILELPEQKKLLSSGYECVMHMHAIAAQISISKVDCRMEKGTGKKVPATFLRSGEKGVCILKIERPICLEKFEFMPSLGRFTLRDEGKTIGYGQILGLKPAKTLLKEQAEQLTAGKTQEKKLEQHMENLKIQEKSV